MSHYNNIFNKKNIEYSLVNMGDKLPYENASKVTLNSKQIIFTSINNVLQRLLDNDLYNEALLKQYIDEGKIAGPITVDSIDEVLNQYDDNKKFVLSSENGIQVVRKKLIPIEETLKGRYLDGNKVNKVSFVNDSYVAATDTGYYVSENKIDWKKEIDKAGIDFVDVCYNKNYLLNEDSLLSQFDWLVVGNSKNGIELFGHYWLSSGDYWKDFSTDETLSSFNIVGRTATHGFSFEGDSKFYIGTKNDGLWSIDGIPEDAPKRENGTNNWTVNDLVEVNTEDNWERYFLATNYGIKQSKTANGFIDLKKIYLFPKNVYVYKIIEKDGKLYVATSVGLAKIENEELLWIYKDSAAYDMIEYAGNVYIACGANGIQKVSSNDSSISRVDADLTVLKLAAFHGDLFFIASVDGNPQLKYIEYGKTRISNVENFNLDGLTIRDLVSTKNVLYVVTSNGIKCVIYKEAIMSFVKSEHLSENKIGFAKNVSANEVIVQTNDDKQIYKVTDVSYGLENGFSCNGRTLLNSVKSGDGYYFLTDEKSVYFLANGQTVPQKIDGISATNIEVVSGKLAFIDDQCDVNLYDGSSVKKISTTAAFSDIGSDRNVLYGLDQNNVSVVIPFETIYEYSLQTISSNPTYNVENTTRFQTNRFYDSYSDSFVLSNTLNTVEASTSSVKISSVAGEFEKTIQTKVNAIDFIGYATELSTNDNPVLVASDNGLNVFSRKDNSPILTKNNFNINGFADWHSYSTNGSNLVSAGSNFAFDSSKLYEKKLSSLFFEEKEIGNIEKSIVIDNVLYFISGNSLFKYNGQMNTIENGIVLTSENNLINLVNVGNDLIACGSGNGAIGVYPLSNSDSTTLDYFPNDIQQWFAPEEIVVDQVISDIIPDCTMSSITNIGGYNLSVHDFAKFSNRNVPILSGNALIGAANSKALFKDISPLENSSTAVALSNLCYLYEKETALIAETFDGKGYSVSLSSNTISFTELTDYSPIENLDDIAVNYEIWGVPVSYGNTADWLNHTYFSDVLIDLNKLSSLSQDFSLSSNELKELDLLDIAGIVSSDGTIYSLDIENGITDISILLSSTKDTVLSIESYVSCFSKGSPISSDEVIEYLCSPSENLCSFNYIDYFGFRDLSPDTSVRVLVKAYLSNDRTESNIVFISAYTSSNGSVTNSLKISVPNLVQRNGEKLYCGENNTAYGFLCKIPNANNEYLTFLSTNSSNTPQFYRISDSKINVEKIEKEYCFVYLKNTDLYINENVSANCGDYNIAYSKPKHIVNDNFNDVLYYSLDGSDSELHVPVFSTKPKSIVDFLSSNENGRINAIEAVEDYLYVATNEGIKYITKDSFDEVNSVYLSSPGVEPFLRGNIIKLVSTMNKLYALDANNKDYEISDGHVIAYSTRPVRDIFVSNGIEYYLSGNIIVSGITKVLSSEQFASYTSFDAIMSSDFYRSQAVVADKHLRPKKLVYDFSTDYEVVKQFTDETIVDVKTLELGDQNILFVATTNKIYYKLLPNVSLIAFSELTGFNKIETFGFTELCNLVVLDDDGLKFFDDSLTSIDSLASLTAMSLNADYPMPYSKYRMSQKEPSYAENQPLVIENGADYSNYLILSNIVSFKENPSKTQEFSDSLGIQRFYRYDGSPLYLVGTNGIMRLENGTWTEDLSDTAINPNVFAVNDSEDYWTLSSGKPLQIRNSQISTYPISLSDPSGVFRLQDSIYYFSPLSNGIYRKDSVYSYESGGNASLSSKTAGRDVYALDFLDSQNYVYNYVSTVTDIASAYSGNSEDTWEIAANVSLFDSSDSDLCSTVNLGYDTQERMQLIKNYGNYVFFSDGGNGYLYDKKRKTGFSISFDDLANMNGGSSKLLHFDSSGYLGYGNLLAHFDRFGKVQEFGTPTKDFAILANNFRAATNSIEVVNDVPDFLVGSNFGLKYVYDRLLTRAFYNRNDREESLTGNVVVIAPIEKSENYYYIAAQGNELYEVTGLKTPKYKKLLTLSADETVTSIFPFQKNEYLIATTKGLYTTDRAFTIQDDLHSITISSVYEIVNEELAKILKNHIAANHISSGPNESFISKLNKKADAELSFLNSTDKHVDVTYSEAADGVKIVENDIIDTIETGGDDPNKDTYVKVAVSNWATKAIETEATYSDSGFVSKFVDPTSEKTFDISTVPYIVKNWKSGLKEIYVYVPSTATYYINNPQGISNSQYTYNSIQRRNVPNASVTNTLPNAATTLRVYLYNSYFGIKTILAAQCVGNSLPLKIYKDNVNADDSWKGFFDTVVQPSTLKTLPMSNDRSVNNVGVCTDAQGRIVLDFAVYGTDAQAIRIIAES